MRVIGGTYRNRILKTPQGELTRPSSEMLRASLFNICQGYIQDSSFLDLFAGSGAVGIEALSRGANSVIFIERDKEAVKVILENIELLKIKKHSKVLFGDVFQMMNDLIRQHQTFDMIYSDPPYAIKGKSDKKRENLNQQILDVIDQSLLLNLGGRLFVEEASEVCLALDHLKTMKLEKMRRIGRAHLYQFLKEVYCSK